MPFATMHSSVFDANEPVGQSAPHGEPAVITVGGNRSDPDASLLLRGRGKGTIQIEALQVSGFAANGKPPQPAPEITGSVGSDITTVMIDLLSALDSLGIIIDSTTV